MRESITTTADRTETPLPMPTTCALALSADRTPTLGGGGTDLVRLCLLSCLFSGPMSISSQT